MVEQDLNEVLNRAAKLMSQDGQRRIENAAKGVSFDNNGDYVKTNISENRNIQPNYHEYKPNPASKLPKVIQDSIMNKPLDDVTSEYSVSASILDSIDFHPKQQVKPHIQEERTYEQYNQPQYSYGQPAQQYIPQPMMTIDYNYIRSIVNECVQANLKQIKDEILKESTLKAIRVGGENKIQLIDNKNNLYESKLEFKRNLNKK